MSDGSGGGTPINLYQAVQELVKVIKLNGTVLKDLIKQLLSVKHVKSLWERLRDKLKQNPDMTIKAAHALILLCLYILVRAL
jgi:hypothetical protein